VIPDILANAGGVTVSYFSGCKTSTAASGRSNGSTRNSRSMLDAWDDVRAQRSTPKD